MSHPCNPIQTKLSKMRSSQTLRSYTQLQDTPYKIVGLVEQEKQNVNSMHAHNIKPQNSSYGKHSQQRMVHLQKKRQQKQQANSFYYNELNRRRQKICEDVQLIQQQFECQISSLEAQLIRKMISEQEIDRQLWLLSNFIHKLKDSGSLDTVSLERLDFRILNCLECKLISRGVVINDLLYSKQTVLVPSKREREIPIVQGSTALSTIDLAWK